MPVSNVFGAIVAARTNPGLVYSTSVSTVASGNTLSAAQFLGGLNTDAGGGGNVTLPTAASVGALLYGAVAVGDTFTFTNFGNNSTIVTAAGMTIIGSGASAASANAPARFLVRVTAVPTDSAGTGTTITLYRV